MENSIKIILDNDTGTNVYFAGQTVSGKVSCVFTANEIIRAIRINYRGFARTQWLGYIEKARRTFWAEEVYLDEVDNLIEGNEENQFCLPAGTHIYPFSYTLPQVTPTSFSDSFGNIQYKIKVLIVRPWKSDYEVEQLLFVISPLDLNNFPLRTPFSQTIEKTITNCCSSAGEITVSIYLPVVGYAANQEINVGTYVQNMSNINVTAVHYAVVRQIKYIVESPYKYSRLFDCKLASCNEGAIGAHAEKSWTSTMKIPVEDIVNFLYCSIMSASHYLEVTVVLPFPHSFLKITCPLTFGTIPLTGIDTSMLGPPECLHSFTIDSSNEHIEMIDDNIDNLPPSEERQTCSD